MTEKPKNYEEAKIFLKGSEVSENNKEKQKIKKIRIVLVPAIFISVITLIGASIGGAAEAAIVSIPLSIISALGPELIDYFKQKKYMNSIADNSFFENNTEEEVISKAQEEAEYYNKHIDKEEGKSK